MLIAAACPQISRVTEFTWFGPAQTQLQILGFFAMTMFGAIYDLLPRVMGFELPFPKLVRVQFLAVPARHPALGRLARRWRGGAGDEMEESAFAFADSTGVAPIFLRAGTTGLLFHPARQPAVRR